MPSSEPVGPYNSIQLSATDRRLATLLEESFSWTGLTLGIVSVLG